MDIRPAAILRQRTYSEILSMGGMDTFQYGILNSLRDGYSFIYAQTSLCDAHIAPVGVDIINDIFESFIVISDDAVSDFLQNGILSCDYDQYLFY